jgi:hypothetical protein
MTSSTQRWRKKAPAAAEKRAIAREKALEHCQQGYHSFTATFRPSESVCLICGLVKYCPQCLEEANLHEPYHHAFPRTCATHQKAEVRA